MVNGVAFRGVFRTLPNIKDVVFCENSQRLKVVYYFCKTLHNLRGSEYAPGIDQCFPELFSE